MEYDQNFIDWDDKRRSPSKYEVGSTVGENILNPYARKPRL